MGQPVVAAALHALRALDVAGRLRYDGWACGAGYCLLQPFAGDCLFTGSLFGSRLADSAAGTSIKNKNADDLGQLTSVHAAWLAPSLYRWYSKREQIHLSPKKESALQDAPNTCKLKSCALRILHCRGILFMQYFSTFERFFVALRDS